MSQKYTGGFITKSPVAPTTTAASGIWTLDQQQQAQKAGTWPSPPIFIEDLFSTYLYTGNGSTQTITNGIDLAGKGGLVWSKDRGDTVTHQLFDSVRGTNKTLSSANTNAQGNNSAPYVPTFLSTGFETSLLNNENAHNFVSWTFRKQPKFFDAVTYTGDGVSGRTVSHSLGAVPGFIITKPVSTSGAWAVAARKSDGNYAYGASTYAFGLNSSEQATSRSVSGLATDTTFTPASVADVGTCNNNGVTYIAYLFAHNAGGFPASGSGSTNGISCGSYTGSSNTPQQITLGYEPQWVLLKKSSTTDSWRVFDNMRGMALSTGGNAILEPNTSSAESASSNWILPNATGFVAGSSATDSATYIYIAIRRGPMKTPTVGTSVFVTDAAGDNASANQEAFSSTFSVDFHFRKDRNSINDWFSNSRLVPGSSLKLNTTGAEVALAYVDKYDRMSGIATTTAFNYTDWAGWLFKRAPSFFDEVCYTGTGSDTTQTHNLGVAPELVIIKSRSNAIVWVVGNTAIGFSNYLLLNATDASASGSNVFNSTAPTSTVFSIGAGSGTNQSGATYVAYLFATLAGVSKVGSYTGTGALQTVNCGFAAGARFVLIKRTDSTGDWWTYDSARGITSGNDPYLYLNSTAAEVTGTNYVDTDTTGFKVTAAAPAGLNANGGTYIFLAVA